MTNLIPLGEIVDIRGGGTPDKQVPAYWNGDIPWASVKDFKSGVLDRTVDRITPEGVAASATQVIPAGHIIVPTRMAVGKAAINTIDLAINQDLKALFPKPDVDTRYLYHALLGNSDKLLEQATGATVKGIKLDVLRGLKIPLPPLEEQKRIAGILDQAAELCRLRTRALDKLNTLGQAIFHEMFPRSDHDIPRKLLGELCTIVRGSSPRPQGDPRYFGGDVPRLMIADITRDGMLVTPCIDSLTEAGARKSRHMDAGSVVMAVSGAVGLPAILACDACIHDGFVGFRDLSEKIMPRFLYQVLLAGMTENKAKGTGAIWTNLTTDQTRRFDIPMPPIGAQENFVNRVTKLERQREFYQISQEKATSIFASLQHRAFRGKL
ncbi:restriction endonuclease subunit S [Komagataeibacter sp. AV436]|uniref:Restriction endonuclease subunit S n=1 Tax=Komagataeibacter melomenusus TaxID=2766578 RepID=A0ABX2ADQ3_9PROT|nr:restriction endonuclease subunit S [Komagataeibacter melomenusus]MBV1829962.1 restriction endonuclease subunit S [Komagataeibacter melomenusus]NPC65979.1 restriction endonuclease subunit S [Komagataeibacter melomenusus]